MFCDVQTWPDIVGPEIDKKPGHQGRSNNRFPQPAKKRTFQSGWMEHRDIFTVNTDVPYSV
jgi:hypothetical protein